MDHRHLKDFSINDSDGNKQKNNMEYKEKRTRKI